MSIEPVHSMCCDIVGFCQENDIKHYVAYILVLSIPEWSWSAILGHQSLNIGFCNGPPPPLFARYDQHHSALVVTEVSLLSFSLSLSLSPSLSNNLLP